MATATAGSNGHAGYMDKAKLAASKPKFKPVLIEGYESPFLIRRLSGKDRIDYLERARATPEDQLQDFRRLREWAVSRAWIGPDGGRILDGESDDDMAILQEMDNEDIETLFAAAFTISREMLEATAERAAETLGNAPSASSPTGSPPEAVGAST